MATLKFTNFILTIIAGCLLVLALQRTSVISSAVAQPPTQPTPVFIMGSQSKFSLPVNLVSLGGHTSVPVSLVSQTDKLAVTISDAVTVKNVSDDTPLAVRIAKSP
jgi:hypothetical protein